MDTVGSPSPPVPDDPTLYTKLANETIRILFYGIVFVCHLTVVSILYYGVGDHIHVWDFSKIVALSGMWAYVGVITSLLMSNRRPELTRTFNNFGVGVSQILSLVGIGWTLFWCKKMPRDEKIYLIALYSMNILCTFFMSVGLGFWNQSNKIDAPKTEKLMDDGGPQSGHHVESKEVEEESMKEKEQEEHKLKPGVAG